jgi:hypothetical protein
VKSGFQDNALSGLPPDRLWRMKRFATDVDAVALHWRAVWAQPQAWIVPPGAYRLAQCLLQPIDAILAHLNKGTATGSEPGVIT